MPRVYVAFILDMIIIFNNIINNSRPPAWYFSLTRTGNKKFTIVGLICVAMPAFHCEESLFTSLNYDPIGSLTIDNRKSVWIRNAT